MQKEKSIKINFIMNVLLSLSSIIFPLITFPYVSRILLPEGTGKVSFATSVVAYFMMLSQLGIPMYGIRACAKVRDDRAELSIVVHELLLINLVMSVASYILLGVCVFMIPKLYAEKTLICIISLTIVLNALGMEWLYKALEQYTYITLRSLVFKVVGILAMFVLVHQKSDYVIYGGISIFAASASNILNFLHAHQYIDMCPQRTYAIKKHLKPIMVFFAMSCATIIYTNLDTVMLGLMTTDTDVGYYNAAVKIKGILVGIVTSLGAVMLPRLSYYIEQDKRGEFERLTKKAMNFVVLIATPMMIYFMGFAKEGIFLLSGEAYAGSIIPMQIIMPTLLLIGMTNVMGIQILVPLGKEKLVLYSEIAGAVVDLVVNAVLIPQYASTGAAIGTLLAELVVWIVQLHAIKRIAGNLYQGIRMGSILVALVLAVIGCSWVKLLSIGTFASLLLSAILFFGIYLLMLTIFKEPLVRELEGQVLTFLKKE